MFEKVFYDVFITSKEHLNHIFICQKLWPAGRTIDTNPPQMVVKSTKKNNLPQFFFISFYVTLSLHTKKNMFLCQMGWLVDNANTQKGKKTKNTPQNVNFQSVGRKMRCLKEPLVDISGC